MRSGRHCPSCGLYDDRPFVQLEFDGADGTRSVLACCVDCAAKGVQRAGVVVIGADE